MNIIKVKGYVAICDECGKIIRSGNRPEGLPNGCTFVLKDGSKVSACTDCIMKAGEKKEGD